MHLFSTMSIHALEVTILYLFQDSIYSWKCTDILSNLYMIKTYDTYMVIQGLRWFPELRSLFQNDHT